MNKLEINKLYGIIDHNYEIINECTIQYDENENRTHYKDSKGYEQEWKYDKNNNLINYKNSDGRNEWYEYDENNRMVHRSKVNGIEEWYEYDENGNKIYYTMTDKIEIWWEYEDKILTSSTTHDLNGTTYSRFDPNGNEIYLKDADGHEEWTEYNSYDRPTHYKDSKGYEFYKTYTDSGKLTYDIKLKYALVH